MLKLQVFLSGIGDTFAATGFFAVARFHDVAFASECNHFSEAVSAVLVFKKSQFAFVTLVERGMAGGVVRKVHDGV